MYLGINLTKDLKDLSIEYYKILMKETQEGADKEILSEMQR